jgi:hypothetical protein
MSGSDRDMLYGTIFFLWQSVGLLGRVISSSQGLYLYINTEKRTYTNKQ